MIIKAVNTNVFDTEAKHIAFAINREGYNDAGFAGSVSRKYWSELANCGTHKIGTVLSKKVGDITYHGLVCHSLGDNGWGDNQQERIRRCFNKIEANGEPIATIAIGTGLIGALGGADFEQIVCGMQESRQNIILHSGYTMSEIITLYERCQGKHIKIIREKIYEIIREIVSDMGRCELKNHIKDLGFEYVSADNIEDRREEILNYLEEMNTAWNEKHVDMTDRQYMKIIKPE